MIDPATSLAPRVAGVALALVFVFGCTPERTVTIEAEPPGAVVWADRQVLGPAPVAVTVPGGHQVDVRVSMPAYDDWTANLTAGSIPLNGKVRVQLKRSKAMSAMCLSIPEGASVFVAGEFRGTTPLTLTGLEPGTLDIVFQAENHEQVVHSLDIADGAPVMPVVEVTLPSLSEVHYRQLIEAEPTNMLHYADLVHYYMLEKEFGRAMQVFEEGIRVTVTGPSSDSTRLWAELDRVVTSQYEYGTKEDIDRARMQVKALLGKLVQDKVAKTSLIHIHYITTLNTCGDRERAQAATRVAWQEFPGDKSLLRLAKSLGVKLE